MHSHLLDCSCLPYILGLLDDHKDIVRCKIVCRHFNHVINRYRHLMTRPRIYLRVDYGNYQFTPHADSSVARFYINYDCFEIKLFRQDERRIELLPSFHEYCRKMKLERRVTSSSEETLKELLQKIFEKYDINSYVTETSVLPDYLLDILTDSIRRTASCASERCLFVTLGERKLAEALNGPWSYFQIYDRNEIINDTLHLLNTKRSRTMVECSGISFSELKPIKTMLKEWAEGKREIYSLTVRKSMRPQRFEFSHNEVREMLRELGCKKRTIRKSEYETRVNLKRRSDSKSIQFLYIEGFWLFMGQCPFKKNEKLQMFPWGGSKLQITTRKIRIFMSRLSCS